MGVQLNIKDEATVRLARDLADASGLSVTATIRQALERAAAAREQMIQDRITKFNEMLAEFRQNMPDEWKGKTSKELMDALYDENGLPI